MLKLSTASAFRQLLLHLLLQSCAVMIFRELYIFGNMTTFIFHLSTLLILVPTGRSKSFHLPILDYVGTEAVGPQSTHFKTPLIDNT